MKKPKTKQLTYLSRFMNDEQLREYFGLSKRALNILRLTTGFPKKDNLVGKTDIHAVDFFFDRRAGISNPAHSGYFAVIDGEENLK